ncbi:MAG: hypothetical protein OEZ40_04795, partial [Candidatus Bathyarchaeota archaeon]|nr:hypothetical protein [Candidatus Bathyarchaeota archaeon]
MSERLFNQLTKKCFSLAIITLVCILLLEHFLFLNADAASANAYEAGVRIGDWIEYNQTWNPTPTAFAYPLLIKREILNVE